VVPAQCATYLFQHGGPDTRLAPLDGVQASPTDVGLGKEAGPPSMAGGAPGGGHRVPKALTGFF
jgi:hypothetical protein